MIDLGHKLAKTYGELFIGKELQVLVEKELEKGKWEGHSENYLKVHFSYEPLTPHEHRQIIPVIVRSAGVDLVKGVVQTL